MGLGRGNGFTRIVIPSTFTSFSVNSARNPFNVSYYHFIIVQGIPHSASLRSE